MPVFSSHLGTYDAFAVNGRLRSERKRRRLTLRQVATKAGVSEAKLSQIENGKLVLDVAELRQIAKALDVPLRVLLPRSEQRHYFVHRGENTRSDTMRHEFIMMQEMVGPSPEPRRHHNAFVPVAEPFVGRHLEPWLVEVHSLPDDQLTFAQHDYEEFVFVLDGAIELSLRPRGAPQIHETLRAGDSAYFRSCIPHCIRSTGETSAHTLNVMHSLGGLDTDDGRYNGSGRGHYRRVEHDTVVHEISDKIALLRHSNGLTIAQLADSVGTSVRRLAQVERGEKPADIDLLLRLSRRFWRPIEYFYSTSLQSEPFHFVQRGRELENLPTRRRRDRMESDDAGRVHVYRSLASGFTGRGTHPYYVQTVASPEDSSRYHAHVGEEFVFVLSGEVEFLTNVRGQTVTETLHPGDSIYFDSSIPHVLNGRGRNPLGSTRAEVIVVFFSPLGEDELFGLSD